jgi:hypothetical protein
MQIPGSGPTLKESCEWLRDDATRIEMILDVVERNSVIEGLPPLTEEVRRRLRKELAAISSPPREPTGSRPPSDRNPS